MYYVSYQQDLSTELPSYAERIGNIYNSLIVMLSDCHVHPMASTWLQITKNLLKNLDELTNLFEKKEQQIEVLLMSLSQYSEDYNELSEWLVEKEQQYEILLQQANSSTYKTRLPLGNKCKVRILFSILILVPSVHRITA